MEKIFGTDGIRGVVGEKITEDFILKLSKSVACFLNKDDKKKKVLIAHDTRPSYKMIEEIFSNTLNEFGIDVVCGGVMPTPCVHYLTASCGFDLAVMITASHNPSEYNGVKIITCDGLKASEEMEEEITKIFYADLKKPVSKEKGETTFDVNLIFKWAEKIKEICGEKLNGMKIALDCANGASHMIAPKIFKELGAEVFVINNSDNGKLINKNCGSTHLEALCKHTKNIGADIGFAFDGDADRVNACYSNGQPMLGEELMFLCVRLLMKNNLLGKNTIVTPNVTNFGIDQSLEKLDVKTVRVGVGGKNIQERLISENLSYGAEDNGHIVWGDYNKCSDGILTAVLISKFLKQEKSFDVILKDLKLLKQSKVNVYITENQKQKFLNGESLEKEQQIQNINKDYRIIVRASGTEPLIRIIVEGQEQQKADEISAELEKIIKDL